MDTQDTPHELPRLTRLLADQGHLHEQDGSPVSADYLRDALKGAWGALGLRLDIRLALATRHEVTG